MERKTLSDNSGQPHTTSQPRHQYRWCVCFRVQRHYGWPRLTQGDIGHLVGYKGWQVALVVVRSQGVCGRMRMHVSCQSLLEALKSSRCGRSSSLDDEPRKERERAVAGKEGGKAVVRDSTDDAVRTYGGRCKPFSAVNVFNKGKSLNCL